MKPLLVLPFLIVFSSHFAKCEQESHVLKVVNTSGVVSNVAYFHILYSFGFAKFENPLDSLLKLAFHPELTESAKRRAAQCPDADHRQITVSHNLTEFFLVSTLQKHNLTALARKRLRENEKDWPKVLPEARVVHAAFYTDMSNVSFTEDTMDEMEDLGHSLNGYFSFGCDMAVCKEDGVKKSIIACHATRGVAPLKRVISKAEYERRYGAHKSEPEIEDGAAPLLFVVGLLVVALRDLA